MRPEQGTTASGLDCAACGHERIIVERDDRATCPSCHRSYSLVVRPEFAMVEWDGWATRIVLDAGDDPMMPVVNG